MNPKLDTNQHLMAQGMGSTQHIHDYWVCHRPRLIGSHAAVGWPAVSVDWRCATLGSRRITQNIHYELLSHDAQRTERRRKDGFLFAGYQRNQLFSTPDLWCIANINPVMLPISLTIYACQSRLHVIYAWQSSFSSCPDDLEFAVSAKLQRQQVFTKGQPTKTSLQRINSYTQSNCSYIGCFGYI
jgi:hypothetical protein